MIHGTVIGLQARIKIVLRLSGNLDIEIECVVDTGFEGFLTLPPAAIEQLELPYLISISANLADNSNVKTDAHAATIIWKGLERNIAVLAMGQRPLIGTS